MSDRGEVINLVLRPLSSLLPHEETIQERVELLSSEMVSDGVQLDPIVIDSETGTVLDGMHRLEAMKRIGLQHAVCYAVDYSSPAVSLQRWVRVVRVGNAQLFLEMLRGIGLDERVSFGEAFELPERRDGMISVVWRDMAFVSRSPPQGGPFQLVRRIDSLVRALGWTEEFVAEDEVDVELHKGGAAVILPRITKNDVLEAARRGRLLPFKTTMHVVDPRPVGVSFPLDELRRSVPPKHTLDERVAGLNARLLPPGSVYGGRRYRERLIVLSAR